MINLPPLYTRIEYTDATEYGPRQGVAVDSLGIHHAVTTSLQAIIDLSKRGGRTVSMTLAVKDDQRVLVVPFGMRPFTSASSFDLRSWTIEAANMTMAPDYLLSDATYESLAIIAAWAHLNGVPLKHGVPGVYQHRDLYAWFGASYPTACAGPRFDINRVINRAIQLLNSTEQNTETALLRRKKEDGMYVKGKTNPEVYFISTDANNKMRMRLCGANEASFATVGGLVIQGGDDTTLGNLGVDAGYPHPVVPEVRIAKEDQ